MKNILPLIFVSLLLLTSSNLFAQEGVGINTDNSNPDASAILDVKSTSQGVLVPRMTAAEKIAIPIPATGLLVFQTDAATGFWYFDGAIWQPISGAAGGGGTLDTAYDFGGAGLGRTITADNGVTEINGTDGFLTTGTYGSGLAIGAANSVPQGAGTRMFFNPKKAAFRAGRTYDTEWDDVNVGNNSTAMGYVTTASGYISTAMGYLTTASGDNSTTMGYAARASGPSSTAMGYLTTASGTTSTAMGGSTMASGNYSSVMGVATTASSYGETTIGLYSTVDAGADAFNIVATDRLFTIGNGTATGSKSDAMVVLKNGNVGIGTSTPSQAKLEVNGFQINTVTGYGYLNATTTSFSTATSTNNFSIWASSRIAGSRIWAHSDKRIKTNIQTTDNQSDLEKLIEIRIADYEFKDKANDGYGTQKKVIAQEIKAIYPSAVDANNTKVIPDIMQFAAMDANWVNLEGHDLKEGDKVRLVHATGAEDFIVQEVKDNSFKVDFDINEEVLVYGREVNDFHVVDYDALTTLNISATQAQQKTIESQAAEIEALKAKVSQLETVEIKFNSLESEVSAIKSLLNQTSLK